MTTREVQQLISGLETSDGAGVVLKRSLGTAQLDYLDPFLLLDEFGSEDGVDYIGGFPDHPHRGFETVTYMLDGIMRHEDNAGNGGSLLPGGVQWMTAGRGIVHSEMPEQKEGLMRGFQLWVNLPASKKMGEPRYQNFSPDEIPEVVSENGTKIRVIAGNYAGTSGAVEGIATAPTYFDVNLPAGTEFTHIIEKEQSAFLYVFEGDIAVGEASPKKVTTSTLAVLTEGENIRVVGGKKGGRFILVAGTPINEPVARHGPFVMNTREEISQAFKDYRAGQF
ncbi:MAG: pirin family protein [Rhodospirillales bacterium]|nr:pirin family protein [Rhodospirillales bacterium]